MTNNPLFASDNTAPVHPKIMQAIVDTNQQHVMGYGEDELTRQAVEITKDQFGNNCDVYFTLTGSGTNIVALKTALRPFHAVMCAESAHVNVHECAAAESLIGCKLITLPHQYGKLTIEQIHSWPHEMGDLHCTQAKVISITQATEYGAVYSLQELKALADFAHQQQMYLHMDGARLCNAAAYLNTSLSSLTADIGVDILSFGGSKNGMLCGEAVIVFNPDLRDALPFLRKQTTQLLSKMRYLSAQFIAFWQDNLWKKNAKHANEMAQYLVQSLQQFPFIGLLYPVQANILFVKMPRDLLLKLQTQYYFYILDHEQTTARWITSFDTTKQQIDYLLAQISQYQSL